MERVAAAGDEFDGTWTDFSRELSEMLMDCKQFFSDLSVSPMLNEFTSKSDGNHIKSIPHLELPAGERWSIWADFCPRNH